MAHLRKRNYRVINILTLLAVATFFLSMQGCASIVKGRNQEVTFKSEPEGATVTLSGGRTLGKTPMTLLMEKKSSDQSVTFEKEGYKPQTLPLTTTMSGWFWGNIVIGGVIGSTTDGVTGAHSEYSPSQYFVTLAPLAESKARDQQKSDTKTFIVSSYKDIFAELNTQPSQYLSSLMTMLKVAPEKKAEFVKELKDLADKFKDIPEFAEQVVKKYISQ